MSQDPVTEKAYYTRLQHFHVKHFGKDITAYEPLSSHGSDRFIVRLKSDRGTCIGIVNDNVDENKAFIGFGDTFRRHGLKTPEVYKASDDLKCYLMEDLGDETLFNRIQQGEFDADKIQLYYRVIEELPKFQVIAGKVVNYNLCYQFNEFAEENIDYDINYFKERFLNVFYKNTPDESLLNNDFNFLKEKILELSRDYFLYRDFQSRNIMIKEGELYFIDYQSGRHGALLYDLASLLYDAKANIPQEAREELVNYYLKTIKNYVQEDLEQYKIYFWYFALIRILQAMGAYGYLGIVRGKKSFLESIPYAVNNINFILNSRIDKNELQHLRKIFNELLKDKSIQKNSE